jgi:hypothetical protein
MEDSISAPSEPSPAETSPLRELHVRRSKRQMEYLAQALEEPSPKTAAIGAAVAELLELLPVLKSTMLQAAEATADPAERLAQLTKGVQTSATVCRLCQALA